MGAISENKQVDINAYVFVHQDMGKTAAANRVEDLGKLFPTSQYGGKTVTINWHFDSKTNEELHVQGPLITPGQKRLQNIDLVVFVAEGLNSGRIDPNVLKEAFFDRIVRVLTRDSKLLIQVGYTSAHAENDGSAGGNVRGWANKNMWEIEKERNPSLVPFLYRSDLIDKEGQGEQFFLNRQDVVNVIERIVKIKLDAQTKQSASTVTLTASPAKSQDQPAAIKKKQANVSVAPPTATSEPAKLITIETQTTLAKEEEKKEDAPALTPVVSQAVATAEPAKSVTVEIHTTVVKEEEKKEEAPASVPLVSQSATTEPAKPIIVEIQTTTTKEEEKKEDVPASTPAVSQAAATAEPAKSVTVEIQTTVAKEEEKKEARAIISTSTSSSSSSSSSSLSFSAPVQAQKASRVVSLILSAIPNLVAAVAAIASRILLPKVKEVGAVGIGFLAGCISTLTLNNYFRNKQSRAHIV